jgi:hypothetical protein
MRRLSADGFRVCVLRLRLSRTSARRRCCGAVSQGQPRQGTETMPARKIMIIRHAEKPPDGGPPPQGVDLAGSANPDELTPRGWQRAGALVTLFAPRGGHAPPDPIERPSAIFAAGTSASSSSLRPQSTVKAVGLACDPPITVRASFAPGDEASAAPAILGSTSEACFVCWEHKHVKDLVRELSSGALQSPHWDGSRFDVTFVLTVDAGAWNLKQVPQLLLPGDLDSPVSEPISAIGARG